MKWKFWSDDEPVIKFKSLVGDYSVATPVVPAGKIIPQWMQKQTEKRMVTCPGMADYFRMGYVVTAHMDLKIKANSAGTVGIFEGHCPGYQPVSHFDPDLVAGLITPQDGVHLKPIKIPLPWGLFGKPGYSAMVVPAVLHSDFLDKLYVYPGVIDIDNFHTLNFVFSPLKEFEIVIPAGAPLLHIIPFKRENMHAECGKATDAERDKHTYGFPSMVKQYYRKFLHAKKSYTMSCPYPHRERK